MSISTSILLLVEKKSAGVITRHTDLYVAKLNDITTVWRKWVREQLSVRYIKGKKNTSLFPKLRSGKLRASLVSRKVTVSKNTPFATSKNQVVLRIPIYYNKLSSNGLDNYGEHLNSGRAFSSSSFSNWKQRAREALEKRIKSKI